MAKLLTEVEADRRGKAVSARSRGMAARDGEGMSVGSLAVLSEEGIDGTFHRAKTVTEDDLRWADKIYAMTENIAANLKRGYPDYAEKIAPFSEKGISDPFGGSLALYRVTKDSILKEIRRKFEEEL